MIEDNPCSEKWYVSEYLDDGQIGIISESNLIVIGVSVRLPLDVADRIVAYHNDRLLKATNK